MKKMIKVLLLILFTSFIMPQFANKAAFAVGDLDVDWGVADGNPIFTIFNMLPGDSETRLISIINHGSVPHIIKVKGIKTGGTDSNPRLETILDIVINDDATSVYGDGSFTGPKTLADFFAVSAVLGIELGAIAPSQQKTYSFTVSFPTSAGNDFQTKSVIFKLIFPNFSSRKLVINEVYYHVKKNHWLPNQFHWYSFWNFGRKNDDDREHDDWDNDDHNWDSFKKGDHKRKNDEWIELYNPSNRDISLKNWTLTDNSNSPTVIHANRKIKAHGFALISRDNDTWRFWNENKHALKIELGTQIGNGLDNSGDHLILKNNNGVEVDRMSWGTDASGFTPNAVNPTVPRGSSTERIVPGFDTDKASDWTPKNPPTPGN